MRILVVDDEPKITRVLRALLASSGYEVVLARDGVEAVDLFRESAPAGGCGAAIFAGG
jgi:two-component system, OmpR family, KDP operon response regulator KdpE